MPWGVLIGAAMAACVILAKEHGLAGIPQPAWRSMTLATALNVGQSLLLIWAIGKYRDATGLNVVYGSRGIWSVLIVWLLGAFLGTREGISGAKVLLHGYVGRRSSPPPSCWHSGEHNARRTPPDKPISPVAPAYNTEHGKATVWRFGTGGVGHCVRLLDRRRGLVRPLQRCRWHQVHEALP